MQKCFLGIDIGTHSLKISVYDLYGRNLSHTIQPFSLIYKKNKIEFDPDILWNQLKRLISRCIVESNIPLKALKAIGISGTNALIAVGKDGIALDKGIMQLDCRSSETFFDIYSQNKDEIFQITGNHNVTGIFWLPKIMWLREYKPEIYKNTFNFLAPSGFIIHKLTGNLTIDFSRASSSMLLDITNMSWSEELCQMFGVSIHKFPKIYQSWEVVGFVQTAVSQELGFKEEIPVIAGCMDTAAAILGLGIFNNNEPFLMLGSLGKLGVCTARKSFNPLFLNSPFVTKGTWFSQAVVGGVGESIQWITNNFYHNKREYRDSLEKIRKSWKKNMLNAARELTSLFFIPNISGKKSPEWNSDSKGIFYGLNFHHDTIDLLEALLEGIGFIYRMNLHLFEENKITMNCLTIGGGRIDEIYLELLATILERPFYIPSIYETETLGAVILAMYGINEIDSLQGLKSRFNPTIEKIEPFKNRRVQEVIMKKFSIYKKLDYISDINNLMQSRKET